MEAPGPSHTGIVTMKELAHAAGVSQPTVSRALQNHPAVAEKTRAHVQEVAARLGYRPNPLVSALMAGIKGKRSLTSATTIAFVTAFPTAYGWNRTLDFSEYFEGAKERAASQYYVIEHFWLKEPGMTARRLSKILYTRGIPGVLIAPLPRAVGHLSLDWSRFASVALGYTLTRPNLARTTNDHFQTTLQALRRLKHLGYRRIGFAMEAVSDARVTYRWMLGFLSFRFAYPREAKLEPLLPPALTEANFLEWFRAHRPDAILAADHRIIAWLQNAGYAIPNNVGFASLCITPATPGIAGMDQNSRLIGETAVDMIVGQLHRNERGIPPSPKLTLIPSTWVDGPTVRKIHEWERRGKQSKPRSRSTLKSAS